MKQNRLVPWFGCDLAVAGRIAALLRGCSHVTIPFSGSAAIVPLLNCRAGILNDLHRQIVNLYRCTQLAEPRREMRALLDATLFHPDELALAQHRCLEYEACGVSSGLPSAPNPEIAAAYFVACWMGRGGHAGKQKELFQGLAIRHNASGGGSAKRFRSAIESLDAWADALRHWECTCMGAFDLLAKTPDDEDNGIYCDPPWPKAGAEYKHKFSKLQQQQLAEQLTAYAKTRVVMRNEDCDLIRNLYRERDGWAIEANTSRNQRNAEVSELLAVRNYGVQSLRY